MQEEQLSSMKTKEKLIKTKESAGSAVKTIDRTATAMERTKSAYLQTKAKAEQTADPSEHSSEEYAADRVTEAGERLSREAVHQAEHQSHYAAQFVKNTYAKQHTSPEYNYYSYEAETPTYDVDLKSKTTNTVAIRTKQNNEAVHKPHQESPDGAFLSYPKPGELRTADSIAVQYGHEGTLNSGSSLSKTTSAPIIELRTKENTSYGKSQATVDTLRSKEPAQMAAVQQRIVQQKVKAAAQAPQYTQENTYSVNVELPTEPTIRTSQEGITSEQVKQRVIRQYKKNRLRSNTTIGSETESYVGLRTKAAGIDTEETVPVNGIRTKRASITGKAKIRTAPTAANKKTAQQGGAIALRSGRNVQIESMKEAARNTAYKKELVRKAGSKAVKGLKNFAEGTIRAVREIFRASKSILLALSSFGWIALVIVVVVLMIGLLAGSSYGVFFSNEENAEGQTMQEVVKEMNHEFENELQQIKNHVRHDESNISGLKAKWPEVLAVYAVYVATDEDNPQEVATITDEKKEILWDIFQQMNELSHTVETRVTQELVEGTDAEGNPITEIAEVREKWLIVTINSKTAQEMGDILGFTDKQKLQVEQLLDEEFRAMWMHVLYGIDTGNDMIVSVAQSQIGNVGGQPYWSWYGFPGRVEWCACFVSWCANECGYIDAGIFPKFAGCTIGMLWFKWRDQWAERDIEPAPGMIVFFDWNRNGHTGDADHVGIVSHVEDGLVYTIEGNSSDTCRMRSYPIGHREIMGYGVPAYCK